MKVEVSEVTAARLRQVVHEGGYSDIDAALEALVNGVEPLLSYSDTEFEALMKPAEQSLHDGRTRPADEVVDTLRRRFRPPAPKHATD
jgi:hypothetical protein